MNDEAQFVEVIFCLEFSQQNSVLNLVLYLSAQENKIV